MGFVKTTTIKTKERLKIKSKKIGPVEIDSGAVWRAAAKRTRAYLVSVCSC